MGKKIIVRIMQSLRLVRAYAGGEVPLDKRMHYFSMNPADGKMVRRKASTGGRRAVRKRQ